MPTLTITKNYDDGTVLTEAQLDAVKDSIETFVNTTKLDSNNIQTNGIATANYAVGSVDATALASSAVTTVKIADSAVTAAKLASDSGIAPTGSILMYGGTSAPSGYFLCNGDAKSRTTYAALFAVIGTSFGYGDNSTTFNVPDLRGRFIRGTDSGVGRDPDASSRTASLTGGATGDNVGSAQAAALAAHTHTITTGNISGSVNNNQLRDTEGSNPVAQNTSSTGGNETRPLNVGVNFIIKI
jgi:microcystin-dependent protein